MKKLLLASALWLALPGLASAQCVGVGGVNNVPQPGISCLAEPIVMTYGATGVGIIPAASATDVACITGSATRIVRVQSIRVTGTGTAITIPVIITKHATANTGGTAAVTTALPVPYSLDSTNTAATATTTAYTANPTIADAAPGVLDVQHLGIAATTVTTLPNLFFNYADSRYMQAPVLRGIAQQVCVNLNATSPTMLLGVAFRWTEQVQ